MDRRTVTREWVGKGMEWQGNGMAREWNGKGMEWQGNGMAREWNAAARVLFLCPPVPIPVNAWPTAPSVKCGDGMQSVIASRG